MDGERILTGCGRSIDGHRMFTAESDAGQWYADCSYGNCPHEANCEIAKRIRETKKCK